MCTHQHSYFHKRTKAPPKNQAMSALTCTHVHFKDGKNMVQGTYQGSWPVVQRRGLMLDQEMVLKGQVQLMTTFTLIRAQARYMKNTRPTLRVYQRPWMMVQTCIPRPTSFIAYFNQEIISKAKSQDLAIHTYQSTPWEWHLANLKCSSRSLDGHPTTYNDA